MKQDWLMRQIEMLTEFVARTVFRKETLAYRIENEAEKTETDLLYSKIQALLAARELCQAEDLLFDSFEGTNQFLLLAVDFYQALNRLSDAELREHNFSRPEVAEGLKAILDKFEILYQ